MHSCNATSSAPIRFYPIVPYLYLHRIVFALSASDAQIFALYRYIVLPPDYPSRNHSSSPWYLIFVFRPLSTSTLLSSNRLLKEPTLRTLLSLFECPLLKLKCYLGAVRVHICGPIMRTSIQKHKKRRNNPEQIPLLQTLQSRIPHHLDLAIPLFFVETGSGNTKHYPCHYGSD